MRTFTGRDTLSVEEQKILADVFGSQKKMNNFLDVFRIPRRYQGMNRGN